MQMGGMQQIIKLGGGELLQKSLLQSDLKMKQILPPPPNQYKYPSNPKLKSGLQGHRMVVITNHPSHLLDYPTTLLLSCPNQQQTELGSDPSPRPDPLLSISILHLRRKIRLFQKNQDTHITKILDMKAENRQLNIDCNNKDAIIQALKSDNSLIIATSLDENNNRIIAMSNPHRADVVMKDKRIGNRPKNCKSRGKFRIS